jgi:hypothetical protein
MDHKIGDLLVDFDLKPRNGDDIFETDPKDMSLLYTFGIIVAVEPIDPEDEYYNLYPKNFSDGMSYSVLWADYDQPVHKYSTDHITHFKKELVEIEKEMDEKNRTEQENK